MRITKVNIAKTMIQNGLEEVRMDRLGQVVMLAGMNGAGKTRILELIDETMKAKPKKPAIGHAKRDLETFKRSLSQHQSQMERCKEALARDGSPSTKQNEALQIQHLETQIESFQKHIEKYQETINWDLIETDELSDSYIIVPFVPKNLVMKDYNSYRMNQIDSQAKAVDTIGVGSLANATFARIKVVQDKWFNATHPDSSVPVQEREEATNEYNRLKMLIRIFLNTDLYVL